MDTAAQISMVRNDLLEGLYQSTQELPIGTAQENKTITCNLLPNVQFIVNGQPFTHSFASGPITDDCILGLDFLLSCDAVVDIPMSTLTLNGSTVDVLIQRNAFGEDFQICRVAVAKSVVLPAKTRQLVEVKFNNDCGVPFVTSPNSTDEILVGSFLLDGNRESFVEVVNDSTNSVTLKKDQYLTNAVELKEVVCSFNVAPNPREAVEPPPFSGEAELSPVGHGEEAELFPSGEPLEPSSSKTAELLSLDGSGLPAGGPRVLQVTCPDLPDWREVDRINDTGQPVCHTFLPPTTLSEAELGEMLQSASEEVPEHLKPMLQQASARLSQREKIALSRLLLLYGDTFSRDKGDLGLFTLLTHRIKTYNEEPVKERLRRTPLKFQKEEEKTLNDMLEAGVIEPSYSEWASAPVLVRKKDGEVRYTVDFRAVNTKTCKDAYPLPLIDECTDTLAGNLWFHTLDLASGYWQIAIHPGDRHKTAFLTKYGLFQHVRMAQGLCNAPATFQRVMHLVLRGLTWNRALVYLDDIIVLGKSFGESLENLEIVLQRIRAHNLKLKPKKCQLFRTEVHFLGRTVSREGVAITNDHVECVLRWPVPRDQHEIERLLGFVNYHRDFLPSLASTLAPLYALTKKGIAFDWTEECQAAFQKVKDLLVHAPVLAYPNNDDPYVLDTDASNIAVAAALYQVQQGQERAISFASLSLTPAQKKYCTTRKELLAVVVFTRRFRHYLLGRPFLVRTDHGSLAWLCRFKNPSGQLGRWLEELSQYDMTIEHRAGVKHVNADSLSRIPENLPECDNYDSRPDLSTLPCGGCDYCHKLQCQWSKFEEDVDFVSPLLTRQTQLLETIDDGIETSAEQTASEGRECVPPPCVRTLSCSESAEGPVESSNYIDSLTAKELRALQLQDMELRPLFDWLVGVDPTEDELFSEGFTTKWLWRHKSQLRIIDGVLYYMWLENEKESARLVVPLSEREEVIRLSHDTLIGGHWGRDKTWYRVSRHHYWPTLRRDVELYVSTCSVCSRQKNKPKNKARLQHYQAGCPGERIHMDFMGPFTTSAKGNRYVLSIIDQFTKWIEVCPLPNQSAELMAKVLIERWIVRFGLPRIIHTDQGRNFESQLFRELCYSLEIEKTRTTPYRPSSNGQVERYNQQIASFIRCFLRDKVESWDDHLDVLGMSLRATVSRATGFTPNLMVLGREVTLPLDILYGHQQTKSESPPEYVKNLIKEMTETFATARQKMRTCQMRGKQHYDVKAKLRDSCFQRGDLIVLVNSATKVGQSKKLQPIWRGPYIITDVISPVLYKVSDRHRITTQHVDRMRLYNDRSVPLWIARKRAQLLQLPDEDGQLPTEDLGEDLADLFKETTEVPPAGEFSHPQLAGENLPPYNTNRPVTADNWSHPLIDMTDGYDSHSSEDDEPLPAVPSILTRSGRQSRLPAHLRDYHVSLR